MLSSPVAGAVGVTATGSGAVDLVLVLRGPDSGVTAETGVSVIKGFWGADPGCVATETGSLAGSGDGVLPRCRNDMASAETTKSKATIAAAIFHCVMSRAGIFCTLAGLVETGRVVVEAVALISVEEAVGDDPAVGAGAATDAAATGGIGATVEAIWAAGAATAGIFCDVVTAGIFCDVVIDAGAAFGATAGMAPVLVATAMALAGEALNASESASAISLPL